MMEFRSSHSGAASRRLDKALVLSLLVTLGAAGDPIAYSAVASDSELAADATDATGKEAAGAPAQDVAGGLDRGAELRREAGKSLREIVVTPRKRGERIQDAPVSVVAVTDEALAARNIRRLDDLGQAVAGLKLDPILASTTDARVYLRGVGQDAPSTALDPGVGLYVDGVYLPRLTGSLLALTDIDRIEVVRGPQGTLFGKNTIGGVVNIITRKPEPTFGADATVRLGNFDRFDTSLNVTGPIASRIFGRLSLATRTSDGFTRSRVEGEEGGDDKLLAGRAQLRMLPTEDLEINLSFEQHRQFEKLPLSKCRVQPAISLSSFVADNTTRLRESCAASADADDFTSTSQDIPKQYQDIVASTAAVEWDLGAFSLRSTTSYRDIKTRTREGDNDGIGVDLTRFRSGKSDLRTVSQELLATGDAMGGRVAWTLGAYGLREDGDGRLGLLIQPDVVADPDDTPLIGRPQITLGGMLLPDDQLAAILNSMAPGSVDGALDTLGELSRVTQPLLSTLSANAGAVDTNLVELLMASSQDRLQEFETLSLAGFGEATFSVTEALQITGGVRYTVERKERDATTLPVFPFAKPIGMPNVGDERSERFGRWTGRAIASYAFTPELLSYVSWSRGFRSGGFNEPAETGVVGADGRLANPVGDKFDTEVLDSFEVGVKSTWFDDRLLLNLSAFYNDYEDIQLQRIALGSTGLLNGLIENAAEATIQGLELDWEARPSLFAGLILSGGVSLIDAEYDEFTTDRVRAVSSSCTSLRLSECPFEVTDVFAPNAEAAVSGFGRAILGAANPVIDRDVDISDLEFKNTPTLSFNVQARYIFDLDQLGLPWGVVDTSVEWYHQGKTFQDTFNSEAAEQSKFGLLNGRMTLELADGSTAITVWGRNLLDRRYISNAVDLRTIGGISMVYFGEPRTYGVELRRLF